jgi:hypothetical protein
MVATLLVVYGEPRLLDGLSRGSLILAHGEDAMLSTAKDDDRVLFRILGALGALGGFVVLTMMFAWMLT